MVIMIERRDDTSPQGHGHKMFVVASHGSE